MAVKVAPQNELYERISQLCGRCGHDKRHHPGLDGNAYYSNCRICHPSGSCYEWEEATPMQIAEWIERYYERMSPWMG